MTAFTESVVEAAALEWLESLGYAVKHGPEIAPGNCSQNERLRRSRPGGMKVRAAVSAKNATTQREGNVQKMHIALKRQGLRSGVLPESWTATVTKNATLQAWLGNCFQKGNGWTLRCRSC